MLISDDLRLKVPKMAKKGYLGILHVFIKTDKLLINITIKSESILNHCFLKKIQRYVEK